MEPSPPRARVAAYVTRTRGGSMELLVFEHVGKPEAGLQVPAGGLRAGETVEQAALREVGEETGLTDLEVVAALAAEDRPHPDTGQPRHTTFLHLRSRAVTPGSWRHPVTGGDEGGGLRFDCRFEPLPLTTALAEQQDAFLDLIRPD